MSKQQRHQRRKIERARRTRGLTRHPTSHMRHGAAALAAAAAIAAGTSAYASPVRFENSAGFDWSPASGSEIWLDVTQPSIIQPGVPYGAASMRQVLSAGISQVDGPGASTIKVETGGPYDFFAVGLDANTLIPSGNPFSTFGFVYYPGYGSIVPEGLTKYLSVRFDPGDGLHYGWIGVVRTGAGLDTFAWGYETDPGVPIAAGVPEPGTLALLALGAAGLSTHRRRRQLAN